MITRIDLPLCVWLVAPGQRYHYAGGANGPYGDTLDAIRIEERSPKGETLLMQKPSEAALVLAAIDNCADYPSIIDWPNLPQALDVSADVTLITVNSRAAIRVSGATGPLTVVLRSAEEVDSVSAGTTEFQFESDMPGSYTIHVFDREKLLHGSVTIEVI